MVESSITPRPDPTVLTTEQLRRELTALRDLIETRLDGLDASHLATVDELHGIPSKIEREIFLLTGLLDSKINIVERRITTTSDMRAEQIAAFSQRIADSQILYKERFDAADLRYQQRYDASEKGLTTASLAAQAGINAALAAAKEAVQSASIAAEKAVAAQNESNAAASLKSELSFTKQIDSITVLLQANSKTLDEKISAINGRLDRGDGLLGGAQSRRTEGRLDIGMVVGVGGFVVGMIAVAFTLLHH